MSSGASILVIAVLGSALTGAAAFCARGLSGTWLRALVSFAVGALLSVALLEILPQLLRTASDAHEAISAMLLGILGFFVLEKLFVWRHHHGAHWVSEHAAHEINARPPGPALTLFGNGVHSLFDGFFIAATFLAAPRLGVLTAIALFAHELTQQLEHGAHVRAGSPRAARLLVPLLATLAGAFLGYALLAQQASWLAPALGAAAASMLYVAMADLIPSLHTRFDSAAVMQQVALIGLGVGAIALIGAML